MSREYIVEATKAYKSGAYRATITYTWLAVVTNITVKIEKLAINGDKEATAITDNLAKIRKNNDIAAFLRYEKEIIKTASQKLELFDQITLIDLERLREDRNRCVHSLVLSDEQLYKPTPEQAKNHLIVAIDRLLKEENVYGKSVLEKLLELINSKVFPFDYRDVTIVLNNNYLANSKESLKRNLLVVLIKDFINHELDYSTKWNRLNVFRYLIENYRQVVENTLREKLSDLTECFGENPNTIYNYLDLIKLDPLFWDFLPKDKRLFVKGFILKAPLSSIGKILQMEDNPELFKDVRSRINSLSRKDIQEIYTEFFIIPLNLCKKINSLYLTSSTYDEANTFARVVIYALTGYDEKLLYGLINGIPKNSQVFSSYMVSKVVDVIEKQTFTIPKEELDELLISNGLKSKEN